MIRKFFFELTQNVTSRKYYCDNSSIFDHKVRLTGPTTRKDPEVEIYGKREITEKDTVPEEINLDAVSNIPEEYRKRRTARIYQRSKSVMQQGTHNTKEWILEFENEERWENPTIGWCSSGDSLSNTYMEFPSLSSAKRFAERQGLRWFHDKPHVVKEFKKSYADNFTWNKRTRIYTK